MVATFVMYHLHRQLQLQYHNTCRADLLRVMLYQNSSVCTHMSNLLQVVEVAYLHAVKQVVSHAMLYLSGGGFMRTQGVDGGAGRWLAQVAGGFIFGA